MSLIEVAFRLVAEFLRALGHSKFQIGFWEANQASFGIVEGFTVNIEIIIMVGSANTIGVLALKSKVAREK